MRTAIEELMSSYADAIGVTYSEIELNARDEYQRLTQDVSKLTSQLSKTKLAEDEAFKRGYEAAIQRVEKFIGGCVELTGNKPTIGIIELELFNMKEDNQNA